MTDERKSPSATTGHVTHFDNVFAAELKRIAKIRQNKEEYQARMGGRHEQHYETDLTGLALSGGGIRSAAFSLGVLQAFANSDALRQFDYLSTVSGGGYTGTALTWFLSDQYQKSRANHEEARRRCEQRRGFPLGSAGEETSLIIPGEEKFGTAKGNHPLGRMGVGAKTGDKNDEIDHIRAFGNYLRPTPELWIGSAAAVILQNVAATCLLWLFPFTSILLILDLGFGNVICPGKIALAEWDCRPEPELGSSLQSFWILAAVSFLLLLSLRISPKRLLLFFQPGNSKYIKSDAKAKEYAARLASQRLAGILLAWACLALAIAVAASIDRVQLFAYLAGAGAITVVTAASGAIKAIARVLPRALLIELGAVLLLIGVMGFAAHFPDRLADKAPRIIEAFPVSLVKNSSDLLAYLPFSVDTAREGAVVIVFVLASLCVWIAFRARLNRLSLHRLYRDRLMETFMPDPPESRGSEPGTGKWRPAKGAELLPLAQACGKESVGPYHIINTNIILVGSDNSVVRARGGESFFLSPLYSGCDRTGWHPTRTFFGSDPGPSPQQDQFLRLSTAMAISGAAFGPNTGPAGGGPMRNPILSRLLMLFGLRLAYWVPNPDPECHRGWPPEPRMAHPGVAALFGYTHREKSAYVELSDGGHFENLGIYELIRRRVPIIVVADAGCDDCFAFTDLANAIERVQVDLGVDIDFSWPATHVDAVKPGSAEACRIGNLQTDVALRGWAIALIKYPEAPKKSDERDYRAVVNDSGKKQPVPVRYEEFHGCLIYLKPALRADLPLDVLGYRAAHSEFPHETTADQFFDETQFEAYRELGYHTCRDFLRSCYVELADAMSGLSESRPEEMPDIFRNAVERLRPDTFPGRKMPGVYEIPAQR